MCLVELMGALKYFYSTLGLFLKAFSLLSKTDLLSNFLFLNTVYINVYHNHNALVNTRQIIMRMKHKSSH